jgi:hypothetical protein
VVPVVLVVGVAELELGSNLGQLVDERAHPLVVFTQLLGDCLLTQAFFF